MENPIRTPAVITLPIEELLDHLEERVRNVMLSISPLCENEKTEDKLMSPKETTHLFSPPISPQTLRNWQNKGLLNKYCIGGRTYYKRKEVLNSLKTLKKYKNNQLHSNT